MVSNYVSYIATNSINTVRIKCTCSSSIKKNTTKQCKNKRKTSQHNVGMKTKTPQNSGGIKTKTSI